MKISNLDHLENFIQNSIKSYLNKNNKIISHEDKIALNSLIVHFFNHPFMEKIYLKSAIFSYENEIFVKSITPVNIENYAKTNLYDVFNDNKKYIKEISLFNTYDDFKDFLNTHTYQQFHEQSFPLKKVMEYFPNINIPLSSLNEVSKINESSNYYPSKHGFLQQIEEYHDDYTQVEKSLTLNEISKNDIASFVLDDLLHDDYYQIFFSESLIKDRHNYKIKCKIIDENFFNKALHFSWPQSDTQTGHLSTQSRYDGMKLLKEDYGLTYCNSDTNIGCMAIYAENDYGELLGILIIGKKMAPYLSENVNNNAKYIKSIAVHKSFRGHGISTELFKKAVDYAKENCLILFRTQASDDGSLYIEKKIDKILKDNHVHHVVNYSDKERALEIVKSIYHDSSQELPSNNVNWNTFQAQFTRPLKTLKVKP